MDQIVFGSDELRVAGEFLSMRKSMKIAALLMLGAIGGTAQAQSFSADLVTFGAAGQTSGGAGKVHVEGGKVRIKAPELPQGFFVVDPDAKAAYFVRPSQFLYMDAKQSSQLTQLLVHVDPAAPCTQWQAMAKVADIPDTIGTWRCERLGEEALDGRTALKYRAISPRGRSNIAWIDPEFKFLLKFRGEDGSGVDVKAIKEGPQDKSLFEIPTNYGKFDPKALIDRIKQSDVWVEPPKK
jgi:hypothetical protein